MTFDTNYSFMSWIIYIFSLDTTKLGGSSSSDGGICLFQATEFGILLVKDMQPIIMLLCFGIIVVLWSLYNKKNKKPNDTITYVRALVTLVLFAYTHVTNSCFGFLSCESVG